MDFITVQYSAIIAHLKHVIISIIIALNTSFFPSDLRPYLEKKTDIEKDKVDCCWDSNLWATDRQSQTWRSDHAGQLTLTKWNVLFVACMSTVQYAQW